MPRVVVVVADGTEEIEAVVTIDVLRRAEIDVVVAGLNGSAPVKCSKGVVIVPDDSFERVAATKYDMLVLPGGLGGTQAFQNSELLKKTIRKCISQSVFVACICAAPLALISAFENTQTPFDTCDITMYPGITVDSDKWNVVHDKSVVISHELIITSRGPGTSFDFALALVEKLAGKSVAQNVAGGLLLK